MSGIHFANTDNFRLCWVLPVALLFYTYCFRKKDRVLDKFGEPSVLKRMDFRVDTRLRWIKAGLILTALLLLIISLTRPQWGRNLPKLEGKGRDIVFVLDVSKSMLAQDVQPNRLKKAKLIISEFMHSRTQDRVALLVFAGSSVLVCPLTLDYGFFRLVLEDIGVESAPLGGTRIGDALRMATKEAFSDHLDRPKDIILLSDGEDQGGAPVSAAEQAGKRTIRLIAVGLGDEGEGQRIPVVNEKGEHTFFEYQGNQVWTRMDPVLLSKMAKATPHGRFLDAGRKDFSLESVYSASLETGEKSVIEYRGATEFEDKFQLFILLAAILLVLENFVSRKRSS